MAKSKKRTTRSSEEVRAVEPDEVHTSRDEVEQAEDRSLVRNIIVVALVLLGLFLLFNLFNGNDDELGDATGSDESSQVEESENSDENNDSDDESSETETQNGQSSGTTVRETDAELDYTVGNGESYTTIARRAVASIGGEMSPAERVAAETKLVSDAQAQWLNAGQNLVLNKDTVRTAVDWAKALPAEQKAAWQPYADLVAW